MAEKAPKSDKKSKSKIGKREKKEKKQAKEPELKKEKKEKKEKSKSKSKGSKTGVNAFSLLADATVLDPALSSLFSANPTPPVRAPPRAIARDDEEDVELEDASDGDEVEDTELTVPEVTARQTPALQAAAGSQTETRRKRKRKADDDNLEDVYLDRMSREEEKFAKSQDKTHAAKRQKAVSEDEIEDAEDVDDGGAVKAVGQVDASASEEDNQDDDDDAIMSPPPKHETQEGGGGDEEVAKAGRTVFLGNVSTTAISSKAARKTLMSHLRSFFDAVKAPNDGEPKHAVESIRFRSTPYATAVPKKAAYAMKEVMDATTKSTNAYAVYTSNMLAREAAKRLNGSVVLDRHLRVDEVAHPAKTDSRRCVFVGNLGFVDDESNMQQAEAEDGKEKRKPGKQPADAEEGLWRSFGKCGPVESVRVIRDSKTRVGKGIAYVQFKDDVAIESALLLDGKKFPPMLPRLLRVTRARAPKRNAKPGSDRPTARPNVTGYQRKMTGAEASQIGRANRMFGRAGAAEMRQTGKTAPGARNDRSTAPSVPKGMKAPESFVFEGHRATSKSGNAGLKTAKRGKKVGKPTGRSAKRGAAFKARGKGKP